jgi:hypothetical protein
MLAFLLACAVSRDPAAPAVSDDSTPIDDSVPAKEAYTCVPLQQDAPAGKAPVASGYEYCARDDGSLGYTHRVEAVDAFVDWTTFALPSECGDYPGECNAKPGDCGAGALCESDSMGGCACVPKCQTDADCGAGMACVPGVIDGPAGAGGLSNRNDCVPAGCLTDADCPSGPCVVALDRCGFRRAYQLQCWSDLDQCHVVADCPTTDGRPQCTWVDDRFACSGKSTCD